MGCGILFAPRMLLCTMCLLCTISVFYNGFSFYYVLCLQKACCLHQACCSQHVSYWQQWFPLLRFAYIWVSSMNAFILSATIINGFSPVFVLSVLTLPPLRINNMNSAKYASSEIKWVHHFRVKINLNTIDSNHTKFIPNAPFRNIIPRSCLYPDNFPKL